MAADESVYATGTYTGAVDFDPGAGTFNLSGTGRFVTKLDSAGNFLWAGGGVGGSGIALAGDGTVYATGTFAGTVDFDPGPGIYALTVPALTDICVSKLSSAGDFVWVRCMGGTDSDAGNAVAVASDGSIYTTGSFRGIADFDPGPDAFNLTSVGVGDVFVSKLSQFSVGGLVWNDTNGNGVQDANEPGVAGAVVELYSSIDTSIDDADDVFQGRAVTDSNGHYTIGGLLPGTNYYEIFRTPVGYTFTSLDAGGDDTKDSDANLSGITAIFTPSAGPTDTTCDAGLRGASPAFGFALGAQAQSANGGLSVVVDRDGNTYVTGDFFGGVVDFNSGPGTYNLTVGGAQNAFVAKYTPTGRLSGAASVVLRQRMRVRATGLLLPATGAFMSLESSTVRLISTPCRNLCS